MVGPDSGDWSAAQQREVAHRLGVADQVEHNISGPVAKADIPRVLQQGDIFL
jgi:hypothetical protein